jgi:diaminohydroxyphosphoribosylaminopyrimidine deaminase/5-amino-6-(5-phosphoribosylamino)uracil reductase
MSTKKDKFNHKDHFYMNLALNLARERIGLTSENPSVGCVIVKNDEVISFGQTGFNGRPHAEYNAIKSCKKNLKDAKIYISLEPCTHYGKTSPCSDVIIRSKIKEVVFSIIDPDIRTKSRSFKIFKAKKIKVKFGLLEKEAKRIYKPYIYNKNKKLPFVTGKLAISKDKFIYSRKQKKITNEYSDSISHLLRYRNDSILITSKTLNTDNPRLDCRIEGLSNCSSKRIILDRNLSIKKNSYIFKTSNKKNTIIFYNKSPRKKFNLLYKKGVKLIQFDTNNKNFFNLKLLLKKIYSLGCRNLLVEGGKTLTNSFLKHNIFNQFYLFQSSNKFGKTAKLNVYSELNQLSYKYKKKSKLNSFTGDDIIYLYSK